jgi:hypothetical protein
VEIPEVEDQRRIAVSDILDRSLQVPAAGHLGERIVGWNGAVFRGPARRTPAAAGKRNRQCSVECTAVCTRLTSGDDLDEWHAAGGCTGTRQDLAAITQDSRREEQERLQQGEGC